MHLWIYLYMHMLMHMYIMITQNTGQSQQHHTLFTKMLLPCKETKKSGLHCTDVTVQSCLLH